MKAFVHRFLVVALGALSTVVMAADLGGGRESAAARFEVERAMCLRGQTSQDRSTCLREAAAAYAQAKREGSHEDETQFKANRVLRCERLPDKDRTACIARMEGQGTTSGSVEGGGIYRELVIVEHDDPASRCVDRNAAADRPSALCQDVLIAPSR